MRIGLVFGDLRRSNILIREQPDREHALLIDFEWLVKTVKQDTRRFSTILVKYNGLQG